MAYLPSNQVYIYPVFNRQSGENPESKLNTEFNLTVALASIISEHNGCFVISWSSPFMKVFMHGYYIELVLTGITTRPLYAHLHLSGNRGGANYRNIIEVKPATGSGTALDESDEFVGLTVDDSATGGSYNLQLLDETGKVPTSSYWKFSQKDINISPASAETESYPSLVWDDIAKKMKTINLSGISLTDDGKGTTFISSLEQSPSGKLSGKTKSFTLVEGTNQGQIKLNDVDINIKGLQSTSEPTFAGIDTTRIGYFNITNNSNGFELKYNNGNPIYLSAYTNVDFRTADGYGRLSIGGISNIISKGAIALESTRIGNTH